MSAQPPVIGVAATFARRNAVTLKLLLVAFLVLLLLVPLSMVKDTLRERLARHDAAIAEITQTWGRSQRLFGPILVVPFTYQTDVEEQSAVGRQRVVRNHTADAYFLPEQLEVRAEIEPSERHRGIYSTDVYAATVHLAGRFNKLELPVSNVAATTIQWSRARVCFALSDLRGTREALTVKWNGADLPLEPGSSFASFGGLDARVPLADGTANAEFSLTLTLNGSGSLSVVPVGRQTDVKFTAPWSEPGFIGAFLPVHREIGRNGFSATWQVSYYGRDFPQRWTSLAGSAPPATVFENAAFGVSLVRGITAYRTVERAIKYGVLFLTLVFMTFFLFETLTDVRLNALNYLLVGLALCLFFLGLLSLSEFIGFSQSYVAAAAASVLLIGLYSWSVLQRATRALLVSAMLGGVYAYLYFVLRMEDLSLVAGTGALFALLAAVMYATRRGDASADGPSAARAMVAPIQT